MASTRGNKSKKKVLSSISLGVGILLFVALFSFQNASQNKKATNLANAPGGLAGHLARQRNISIEEAQVRIGWQEKASSLGDKLQKILPAAD